MIRRSSFFWASDSLRERDDKHIFDVEESVGLSLDEKNELARNAAALSQLEVQDTSENRKNVRSPLLCTQGEYGTSEKHQQQLKTPVVKFAPGVSGAAPCTKKPPCEIPQRKIFPDIRNRLNNVQRNKSIRFQVVVWYVGAVDVVLKCVSMRFRITIFWHADTEVDRKVDADQSAIWVMQGRQKAYRNELYEDAGVKETVDVPPISILNAISYEADGNPEVTMLRKDTKLMRWSCMYNATLSQEDMRVDDFPHDKHDLVIKIGILAHRGPGHRWDRKKWTLNLATNEDSQGSTRIPYGLVVDHVSVPDFLHDKDGLQFEFVPLSFGSGEGPGDKCLHVKLTVVRDSGQYDKNIMPTLALLNIVAISCIPRNFASATASTEIMLGIAFVEIGIRLSIDSRLPSVGYQIKMQRILNQCFWMLCFLVLESNVVFFLVRKRGWKLEETDYVDLLAAIVALFYTMYITWHYYREKDMPTYDRLAGSVK